MTTTVVNIHHERADVYCGRGTRLGNHFMNGRRSRKAAIVRYDDWFLKKVTTDQEFREHVLSLRGLKLGCHCKPLACHLESVVEWIDSVELDAIPGARDVGGS